MCLRCATLPYKARYKHDRHFLTFREGKRGSKQSDWCDVCEKRILYSENGGFYSCDDCCTSIHVDCLLGTEPYMKPGHTIRYLDEEYEILPNNTLSQPFCHVHNEAHCRDRVVYKKDNMILCSYDCLEGENVETDDEDEKEEEEEDEIIETDDEDEDEEEEEDEDEIIETDDEDEEEEEDEDEDEDEE